MGEILELYFDEGGDFSIGSDPVDLLIVSVAAFRRTEELANKLSLLEGKLSRIGYTGAIHTAPLVRKAREYSGLTLGQRREVFWALYNFARAAKVEAATFVFVKYPSTSYGELYSRVDKVMSDFISQYASEQPRVFYDGGQRPLMNILYKCSEEQMSSNNYYADFDRDTNRIFQVADLMTYVYRLVYKLKKGLPLSASDSRFFTKDSLGRLERDINPKTTP